MRIEPRRPEAPPGTSSLHCAALRVAPSMASADDAPRRRPAATCCCFPSWKHKCKGELREDLRERLRPEHGSAGARGQLLGSSSGVSAAVRGAAGGRPCTDGGFSSVRPGIASRGSGATSRTMSRTRVLPPTSGTAIGVRPLGVRGPLPPERSAREAHQPALARVPARRAGDAGGVRPQSRPAARRLPATWPRSCRGIVLPRDDSPTRDCAPPRSFTHPTRPRLMKAD